MLPVYREQWEETKLSFPEYNHALRDGKALVLGKFGAFATPSSFHNRLTRHIRALSTLNILEHAKEVAPNYLLETLPDRMCERPPKTVYRDTDSTHRDMGADNAKRYTGDRGGGSPLHTDDLFLSGVINLSERDEAIMCIPGTHVLPMDLFGKAGYGRLKPKKFPITAQVCNSLMQSIKIPPGAMVVYNPLLIHQNHSNPKKSPVSTFLLFPAWRLSISGGVGESIISHPERILKEMRCPLLPSGQFPPMYSQNHTSFFLWHAKHSPIVWSKGEWLHPSLLTAQYSNKAEPRVTHTACVRCVRQPLETFFEGPDDARRVQYPTYGATEALLYSLQPFEVAQAACEFVLSLGWVSKRSEQDEPDKKKRRTIVIV